MSDLVRYLTYVPKYIYLDGVIQKSNLNKIRIFVDLKGCLQNIYAEHGISNMLTRSKVSRHLDMSIFEDFLSFINFHKSYAKKRGIDFQMFFFMERGSSRAHESIDANYKISRKTATVFGLDESNTDLYFKILNKNFDIITKVGNQIPNVAVIRLDRFEADFIPYYLMERVFEDTHDWANIIYSGDKDMYQCLTSRNKFVFSRNKKSFGIINGQECLENYLGASSCFDAEDVPVILAIMGDEIDDVKGIRGIGPKTVCKISKEIKELFGPIKDMYEKINKNENIFNPNFRTNNKYVSKIIENEELIIKNIKLTSYKYLSDYIESEVWTNNMKMKEEIFALSKMNTPRIKNGKVLLDAFEKAGISLELSEESIYPIFE
jgi:hypothetical protein